MSETLRVVCGDSLDPYRNLAVEQLLLESVGETERILYLWQNQRTVVIGRNQNAWRECRHDTLERDGGHLARRLSGGGAVYHDLGNLNFTFLVRKENYDLDRQLEVVLRACRSVGVRAGRAGRNDLLAEGRKFSGSAYYDSCGCAYHHGTLLLNVDMEALARYLRPSAAKLAAKGVESVRARVVNLAELAPGLTAERMRAAMVSAFEEVFDGRAVTADPVALPGERLEALTARNRSFAWLFGRPLPFTCFCEQRFPWGELRIELQVENGVIAEARVWSDAMDWRFAAPMTAALTGCRLTAADIGGRLTGADIAPDFCRDALQMLRAQIL